MPLYLNKTTFLANGLEPYVASLPSTPRSPPYAPTSGPLFDTTSSTEPLANAPPPPPSPSPTSELPPTCPICLSTLLPSPPAVRIRGCSHAYHSSCLSRWLDRASTCPACRAVLFASASVHRTAERRSPVYRGPVSPPPRRAFMQWAAAGRTALGAYEDEDEGEMSPPRRALRRSRPRGVGASAGWPSQPLSGPPPLRRVGRRETGVSAGDVEEEIRLWGEYLPANSLVWDDPLPMNPFLRREGDPCVESMGPFQRLSSVAETGTLGYARDGKGEGAEGLERRAGRGGRGGGRGGNR